MKHPENSLINHETSWNIMKNHETSWKIMKIMNHLKCFEVSRVTWPTFKISSPFAGPRIDFDNPAREFIGFATGPSNTKMGE